MGDFSVEPTPAGNYQLPFGIASGQYPTMSQLNSGSFYRNIYGGAQATPSSYGNGVGGFNVSSGGPSYGSLFSGGGGGFGGSSGGTRTGSSGNINNTWSGSGGGFDFGNNTPSGYNPYQFMPSFQQFQRPDSPVAGLTPEEEFLRQYQMGQLLGEHPGEDTAYNQLMSTVGGDYLSPETNPFLGQIINALGNDTANQLNRGVNDILSRAGTAGALGGSRSALMQGTAAGEATRGFNTNISDLLNKNYQNERQLQLGAIPELLSVENAPTQRTGQAMGLADIPRNMQQALIDAQMQEWLRQQNERFLPIQVGQSVMGQRMGQQIPIVQPQQSPYAGLGQLAQGVGSIFSGYNSATGGTGYNPLNIFSPSTWGNLFGGGPDSSAIMDTYGMGSDPYSGLMGSDASLMYT